MKYYSFLPMPSLQIFAEGGASGDGGTAQGQGVTAGAASQQTKGVKGNPLAAVKYGVQSESAPAAEVQTEPAEVQPDLGAEFEELIKGKYKAQYDGKVQDTIRNRLKGKDTQIADLTSRQNAVAPILEALAGKYGVDASDIAALSKAIEEDDSYFQEAAMAQGMTVKQYKEWRNVQKENAALKQQMSEQKARQNADQQYFAWMNQAESTKAVYPSFDLKAELANPKFLELLNSNIDVRTAYEVIHRDEIIPAAMQFAAKSVESKIAKKIAAQGARPAENGIGAGSAALTKSDVSQLSKNDIAEISRRVARGERITFG